MRYVSIPDCAHFFLLNFTFRKIVVAYLVVFVIKSVSCHYLQPVWPFVILTTSFISRLSDSTVSKDAGTEAATLTEFAVTIELANYHHCYI
jgi:hypothetical protein